MPGISLPEMGERIIENGEVVGVSYLLCRDGLLSRRHRCPCRSARGRSYRVVVDGGDRVGQGGLKSRLNSAPAAMRHVSRTTSPEAVTVQLRANERAATKDGKGDDLPR